VRSRSFFDPQLYLPHDEKNHLATYEYFPTKIRAGFTTTDFDSIKDEIAEKCVQMQIELDFEYVVIPSRYFDPVPSNDLEQQTEAFVTPFIKAKRQSGSKKQTLLTCILNESKVLDETQRNDFLNWVTSLDGIDGIYLLLLNSSSTKMIKNPDYLSEVMYIIDVLHSNGIGVNLGYTNVEGLLYSIAFPDSITCGSYENLRRFGIKRFVDEEAKDQRGPNARLYSATLLQWIEYGYVAAIQKLYPRWDEVFTDSRYKPLIFSPTFKWHFQKPELYKHFFLLYSHQTQQLNDEKDGRRKMLIEMVNDAIERFKSIQSVVHLDENSDGSHLYHWLNAIALYDQKRESRA
jgi:hypothetical protein